MGLTIHYATRHELWQIYSFACKLSDYYTHLEMIWPPQKSVYLQNVHLNYGLFSPYKKTATDHTVQNLHFLFKNSTLISRENCRFFRGENVMVLDFLAVDNFDFTRKFVKTYFSEKLVKMFEFCQN